LIRWSAASPPIGVVDLSDRIGYLPKRLAASRKSPMSKLVREILVRIDTGKVLRIFTNDLTERAQEVADLGFVLPLGQPIEDHSLLRNLRKCRASRSQSH